MQAIHDYHKHPDGSPNYEAASNESTAVLIAGSDTTSNTITFLSYLLASSPLIQDRLQQELDAAFPDLDYLPFFEETDRLPFLSACVKEGLRMYP